MGEYHSLMGNPIFTIGQAVDDIAGFDLGNYELCAIDLYNH